MRKVKSRRAEKRQLAALATLLGLMAAASKLSDELQELAKDIGGSLDEIVDAAGLPFHEVHNAYRAGPRPRRKGKGTTR